MNKHKIKKEISFQKFMEASLKVFAEKGYEKASLDDIAREAGYTKGAFYIHFSSKEELFLKLMKSRLEVFKQQFLESFTPGENIEDTVRAGVALFVHLTKKDNWAPLYFEFCVNAIRNDSIKKHMADHYQDWIETIIFILKQSKECKSCKDDVLKQLAATIIALLDGYHLQESISPNSMSQDTISKSIVNVIHSIC
ncbi:putative HTH-type transcriptional regulator YwcC [Collibacillus ludicampi]|uniref:HTH-type transcriptional regulator YwcC n=1 Tax=Collibacillus ludicampi TaxID=2771369 RepID=A0AAV4LDN4_9BACL|nr:TetR/AcrR family transcriptional regulator [Collibacillus ludicampi]GIM45768.1 putative HTH-type transcriptional regulator YwcC [Collibacillus ludicampi]